MSFWSRTHAAVGAFRADGGQSYTDAVFSAFDSIAGVDSIVQSTVSAVEVVAGRVERGFSSARVDGSPLAKRIFTPDVLGDVGRGLIERGESLHLLEMGRDGSAALVPSEWSWEIYGDADPATWVIGASVPTPSGTKYVRRADRGMALLHGEPDAVAAVSWRVCALPIETHLGTRRRG